MHYVRTGQRNEHHEDKCILNSVQNTTNIKAFEENSMQNTMKMKNKLYTEHHEDEEYSKNKLRKNTL